MFLFRRGAGRPTPEQARTRTSDVTAVPCDVREVPRWRAGRAPGAVSVPLIRLLDGAALPTDAQGRPVVAICRFGHRSQRAGRLLASRGSDDVDVTGGMSAWAQAGLPVVDERGQSGWIA
ncbi:rhodanese-like domain-containing protein [Streptomyces natalensis]|uniref:Sulfurtransferase n=1 Tax=Streptomyces natalensis ATCC 27448 TaxID=1240678 RepID=A0A0D7CK55_9ACTN|nr:rhodanese-like domain-containing protein [Streptomyces natalensis]KIZ16456.1 sulfurtransferase [Streptomyces natalensis ATCC 27448]